MLILFEYLQIILVSRKKANLKGELNINKSTISRFEMGNINGGDFSKDYYECSTGSETLICCATVNKACGLAYIVCRTGSQTVKC